MDTIRYIKSFSKGQITIPKDFRDMFGIGDEFWLKLSVEGRKMIAEPVESTNQDHADYAQTLLSIKDSWNLDEDIQEVRKEITKKLKKHSL